MEPSLTALRKEYAKACRLGKKHRTEMLMDLARISRPGYFKVIKQAKNFHWSDFLARTRPHNIWMAKKFVTRGKIPCFPNIPGASSLGEINKALLDSFFPPKPELPTRSRLHRHASADPLTKEEIAAALAKFSPSSAPGPDGVPYSLWNKVNTINSSLLLDLLAPPVTFGYHPTSLTHANGVVLDKPGKPSYDTPASPRIIVLLKTVSKVLERILTVRLTSLARRASLLQPNQCGSLPGLSTSDAVATLTHEVNTLQRPLLQVSTLFLDIKAGFDIVNASKLRSLLSTRTYPHTWSTGSPPSSQEGNAHSSSKAPKAYPRRFRWEPPKAPLYQHFSCSSTSPPSTFASPQESWSRTWTTSPSRWHRRHIGPTYAVCKVSS